MPSIYTGINAIDIYWNKCPTFYWSLWRCGAAYGAHVIANKRRRREHLHFLNILQTLFKHSTSNIVQMTLGTW